MATIVIYDSGVGGLSIYQEVVARCPNHHYVFVSDNQAFPYGTKTEAELIDRVTSVTEAIQREHDPELLVVACNSASTIALPALRERFLFQIVGVVPAIKPAAHASANQCIGLLATPGTIARSYTDTLIQEYAADCKVIKVGSSELVDMAESKLHGRPIEIERLAAILQPFVEVNTLDVVVLACTHFPLLRNEIAQVLGPQVQLLDSGAAIASRVAQLTKHLAGSERKAIGAFTRPVTEQKFIQVLRDFGITDIQNLRITT